MTKSLSVIFLVMFVSIPGAHAAIYKCKNEYGKTVFQDKPCDQTIKVRTEDDVKKLIDSKIQQKPAKQAEQS